MKKWLRLVALLTVMVIVTASCITIRQFSFSKTNLDISQDDITTMRLRLKLDSDSTILDGYLFVLVGLDEELESLNRKDWQDIDGAYGMNKAANVDAALLARLQTNGVCSLGGGDVEDVVGSYSTWKVFRTNKEIDLGTVDVTNRLNFVHNLGIGGAADPGDVGQILAVAGVWADDGDGVVESADTFICNSAIATSVTFRS